MYIKRNICPTHPGIILNDHYLIEQKISNGDFARKIGIKLNRLENILSAKERITKQLAKNIARELNTSKEMWITGQNNYDNWGNTK